MVQRDDLYTEYLRLVLKAGEAERAEQMIQARNFHPWEGGEGKVTRLDKEIKCACAEQRAAAGDFENAMKKYREALSFPENLGEGKLILDTNNDVYYRMGELAKTNRDSKYAEACYRMAAQ